MGGIEPDMLDKELKVPSSEAWLAVASPIIWSSCPFVAIDLLSIEQMETMTKQGTHVAHLLQQTRPDPVEVWGARWMWWIICAKNLEMESGANKYGKQVCQR